VGAISQNPCSRVLPEKLLIFPMINKLPSLYGTPGALEHNIEIFKNKVK
jgi:hypothetical protein